MSNLQIPVAGTATTSEDELMSDSNFDAAGNLIVRPPSASTRFQTPTAAAPPSPTNPPTIPMVGIRPPTPPGAATADDEQGDNSQQGGGLAVDDEEDVEVADVGQEADDEDGDGEPDEEEDYDAVIAAQLAEFEDADRENFSQKQINAWQRSWDRFFEPGDLVLADGSRVPFRLRDGFRTPRFYPDNAIRARKPCDHLRVLIRLRGHSIAALVPARTNRKGGQNCLFHNLTKGPCNAEGGSRPPTPPRARRTRDRLAEEEREAFRVANEILLDPETSTTPLLDGHVRELNEVVDELRQAYYRLGQIGARLPLSLVRPQWGLVNDERRSARRRIRFGREEPEDFQRPPRMSLEEWHQRLEEYYALEEEEETARFAARSRRGIATRRRNARRRRWARDYPEAEAMRRQWREGLLNDEEIDEFRTRFPEHVLRHVEEGTTPSSDSGDEQGGEAGQVSGAGQGGAPFGAAGGSGTRQ